MARRAQRLLLHERKRLVRVYELREVREWSASFLTEVYLRRMGVWEADLCFCVIPPRSFLVSISNLLVAFGLPAGCR
jgi:hypothetical protein